MSWYGEPNAIGYAKFFSRSHDAVIRVYDEAGNVIETHEHAGRVQGTVVPPSKFSTCNRRLLLGKTACDRPTETYNGG